MKPTEWINSMKNCKRCGKAVQVYRDDYDVFEGMHWLCFHMEYEHGSYDPDEPCDDPSCPWNRFNHKNEHIFLHDQSLVVKHEKQFVGLIFLESQKDRYPSTRFKISIKADYNFVQYDQIWIDIETINNFIQQSIIIESERRGKALINSMSPDEFCLELSTNNRGILIMNYKLESNKLGKFNTKIQGHFEIYNEDLLRMRRFFKEVVSFI